MLVVEAGFVNGMDAPTPSGTSCAKVQTSAFPLESSGSVHHESHDCRQALLQKSPLGL